MAPIAGEPASPELEGKRADGSWHPCRVSLSSGDAPLGIVLAFENCEEEDMIITREEALARLRFRSTFLQDGECSQINDGECVLAIYKGQCKNLFLDAIVEKINRMKHSIRVYCRCTFKLKWLTSQLEDDIAVVSSKSIMRLSNKDIDTHPVFASFLTALNGKTDLEFPQASSLLEETSCEADLHGLLEKQVEEISKLDDGFNCLEDNISGVKKVNQKRQKTQKQSLRRSTSSQTKQPEPEIKEHTDDAPILSPQAARAPMLSPLAARAALASLVHEIQKEAEFSTNNRIFKESLDVNSIVLNSDAISNPSENLDSGSSRRKDALKISDQKKAWDTSALPGPSPVAESNLCSLTVVRRLTRSSTQREKLNSPVSTITTHYGDQKARYKRNNEQDVESLNLTRDVEYLVIPKKNEAGKKKKTVDSSADTMTVSFTESQRSRASRGNGSLEDKEGAVSQDAESKAVAKKRAPSLGKLASRSSRGPTCPPRTRSQVKK